MGYKTHLGVCVSIIYCVNLSFNVLKKMISLVFWLYLIDCLFVRGMTTASVESMSSESAGENSKGIANTRFGSGFGVLTFVSIAAVGFVAGLV